MQVKDTRQEKRQPLARMIRTNSTIRAVTKYKGQRINPTMAEALLRAANACHSPN